MYDGAPTAGSTEFSLSLMDVSPRLTQAGADHMASLFAKCVH